MSADFPEDLAGKRDELLQRATARGSKLRMRRRAAIVGSLVLVFSVLAGTVAVIADGNHANRVVTSEPDATTSTSDAPSTTVADSTTTMSTEAPPTSTPDTTGDPATPSPESVTTVLVCHNSHDPRCGPLTFTSTPVNQPLELSVEQTVTGDTVDMVIHASDDTAVDPCMRVGWGDEQSSYGPGPTTTCITMGMCIRTEPRYGPWDPPESTPETINIDYKHTYNHAGTYEVTIDAGSVSSCSPDQFYSSTATKTVNVAIDPPPPPPPTTATTTTTTTTAP